MIAGTGDDGRAKARRPGQMRASDADRDQVIDTLKAGYVYGLVTKAEFDDRVGQTLAARTYAELAAVTADIPAGLGAAPLTLSPAPKKITPVAQAGIGTGERAVAATAMLAALGLIAAVWVGGAAGGMVAAGAVGSALLSLLLAAALKVRSSGDRHAQIDRGSGGQLPPDGGARAASGGSQHLPPPQPGRPTPAEAARRLALHPRLST